MPVCTRNRKSLHGDGTASAAEENDPVCIRAAYSHSPCCGYTEHVSLPTSLASVPLLHHRSSTTEGIISTSFSVAGCFPEVLQGKGSTHMLESSSTRLNPWLGLREVSRRITVKLLKNWNSVTSEMLQVPLASPNNHKVWELCLIYLALQTCQVHPRDIINASKTETPGWGKAVLTDNS